MPIPSNAAWKITNDFSANTLLEAALRLVIDGGDRNFFQVQDDRDRIVIDLRTDEELSRNNTPAKLAPIASFGKFLVVDRDEIEGYRSIQQLLRDDTSQRGDSQQNKNKPKPLSITVFGPPGSGKSFGIKEVAEFSDDATRN